MIAPAAKLFNLGAGLKVAGFWFYAGQWYQVRKGAVPVVKVKPEQVANLNRAHADAIAAYRASLVSKVPPVAPGKSPKPLMSLADYGGSLERFRRIHAQKAS